MLEKFRIRIAIVREICHITWFVSVTQTQTYWPSLIPFHTIFREREISCFSEWIWCSGRGSWTGLVNMSLSRKRNELHETTSSFSGEYWAQVKFVYSAIESIWGQRCSCRRTVCTGVFAHVTVFHFLQWRLILNERVYSEISPLYRWLKMAELQNTHQASKFIEAGLAVKRFAAVSGYDNTNCISDKWHWWRSSGLFCLPSKPWRQQCIYVWTKANSMYESSNSVWRKLTLCCSIKSWQRLQPRRELEFVVKWVQRHSRGVSWTINDVI